LFENVLTTEYMFCIMQIERTDVRNKCSDFL